MQLPEQIQKYISFSYRLIVFQLLLGFILPALFLFSSLNKLIPFNLGLYFSLVGLITNLFFILRRYEKINVLKILKEKSENGDAQEKKFAKQIFNSLMKNLILRRDDESKEIKLNTELIKKALQVSKGTVVKN